MIVGVAILKDGLIYALPRPARHPHLFAEYNDSQRETVAEMVAAGKKVPPGWLTTFVGWPAAVVRDGEQGFVDDRGSFLTREDAAAYALDRGQICEPLKSLTSEDIW